MVKRWKVFIGRKPQFWESEGEGEKEEEKKEAKEEENNNNNNNNETLSSWSCS